MEKTKKRFQILGAVIAGLGILAILVVCLYKYIPSSEHMDPTEYFGETKKNEILVIADHDVAPERAHIYDGAVYLDYELVRRDLNSRFYWDESEGKLLFTNAEQVFEITPNATSYLIDGESFDAGYEILKTTSSNMFLSMNFVQQNSDLICKQYENPQRIVVTKGSTKRLKGVLDVDAAVRYQGGIKSPILAELEAGNTVRVLDQMDSWTCVMTEDGIVGYIKNNNFKEISEEVTETFYNGPEYTSLSVDGRLELMWHQIDLPEMNANFDKDTENMTGVNVISPTWYFLNDNEGNVDSFADAEYVKKAHDKGLMVWALVSNFNPDVSTYSVLSSRKARTNLQNYLIQQAKEFGFDGINIDLEGISQDAGPSYVQFMRELSILCRKEKLYLSVDVPVPMDFSVHYNRGELGVVCDYVIMMGYDEHYAGSDLVGSVASMDFEHTGIVNMLLEVSNKKLVSAIPFYSRLWYTETLEDGTTKVTSEAKGMNGSGKLVEENQLSPVYDESTGQLYAEWTAEDGRFCQIWLEDENSVAKRASMVREFDLGGIAAWVLTDEKDYVWDIIKDNI